MSDYLSHYGVGHNEDPPGRGSGRYEYGSGENAYQRLKGDIVTTVNHLQKKGMSDSDIALQMGITRFDPKLGRDVGDVKKLRAYKQLAVMESRSAKRAMALELLDKHTNEKTGKANVSAAARELSEKLGLVTVDPQTGNKTYGVNESSFRSLINDDINNRKNELQRSMDILKDAMKEKKYIDVGVGTAAQMEINNNKLDTALIGLESEGYHVYTIRVPQAGTSHMTTMRVLAPPDATYSDVFKERDQIKPFTERVIDPDGNVSKLNVEGYSVIDPKRVMIRYNEEGGLAKDGTMELRSGVPDISLGQAHYAQVRIAVDVDKDGKEDRYLKGMAMYAPNGGQDMPPGVDIIFNTNKHVGTPMEDVLKEIKYKKDAQGNKTDEIDVDNPFGATIKRSDELKLTQKEYIDPKTGEKKLSAINIVNEEGDWSNWSKTLSSQFLSKQTEQLAERQLNVSYAQRMKEFEEIKSLNNATVKRELLNEFADNCDSAAVHLKAAALPHQGAHVILPLTKGIKENEIYAPNYENGTEVVLIRYPHAGRFEIPRLIVNNNSRIAKDVIGPHPSDAVGIHSSVAETLSGADFDGDTVMVIPTKDPKGRTISDVKTEDINKTMPGLVGFDPKESYKGYPGMKVISNDHKQRLMGEVSNLITDMQVKGCESKDLEKVVKLSMVVIDAEKHKLDYKRAFKELDIADLKAKYQRDPVTGRGGAATLISRAKSEERVDLRKQWYASNHNINPETGEKIQRIDTQYGTWVDKNTGEIHQRTSKSTKMAEAKDARELLSGPNHEGTPMEIIYADYANNLKRMANEARKEYLSSADDELSKSSSAAKQYKAEVDSLNRKLLNAQKNAPYERSAQLFANAVVAAKERENPGVDKDTKKKWKFQALAAARARYGAEKEPFRFTDKEWEAVQAGAVGKTNLRKMMQYCDKDELKQRAMPKESNRLSDAQIAYIKALANSNLTQTEIAQILGKSTSTISRILSNRY